MQIIPTVLCGGAGSRLWPVSRALHPKPFIRLSDGQSLLQKAFLRGANLAGVKDILTVANREMYFKIQDEYAEVNLQGMNTSYILEPFGRNTAAAIAVAAQRVVSLYGEDAVMLILAADHLIQWQDAFQCAVDRAVSLARTGRIVTFGIQPDRPETGYGYIEVDAMLPINLQDDSSNPTGFQVHRFVEKPNASSAQTYVDSGNYVWNAGMFCFTAGSVLEQMARVCPEVLATSRVCIEQSLKSTPNTRFELDPVSFAAVPEVSFDYAVMEPLSLLSSENASLLAVVPCAIGWSDIGSWGALGDLSEPDASGNRVVGEVMLKNTTNCTIHSQDRLVGTVGVKDLIIVDTPDALLVADKDSVQSVKDVYEGLKAQGHQVHKLHRTVHRPWGTYTVLEEGDRFKIKRIEVKPGGSLSLQMHHHRSEHWIVVQGMAQVVNGDRSFLVGINESTYIPAGNKHRLENPGMLPLVMIEVQSGEYLGEDDIVRFEDNYGRIEVV
jgi:mannose-1-phosphate guanylyltransferase/mannose-6-phosphate isomerase